MSLAAPLGFASPFFCTLIAYTLFGLDALGDLLEEPFGEHSNALPLHALTRIIEVNLLEAMGETDLPPFLQPVDHELRLRPGDNGWRLFYIPRRLNCLRQKRWIT